MKTATGKSKKSGKPLLKFFGLMIFQMITSFAVIAVYRHTFLLSARMMTHHMIIVFIIYCLLSFVSVLFLTWPIVRDNRATKYLLALVWSCTGIFLYAGYLLAFSGKQNMNQVYTFPLVLSYTKNFRVFIQSLTVPYPLVFLFLFIVPACIIGWHFLLSNIILKGLVSLQKIFFGKRSASATITLSLFLFGTGFCAGAFYFDYSDIVYSIYRREEPIVSAFMEMPLQANMYFGNNIENPGVRDQYPKNINFEKLNVVIVVVDALRADHLSLFGYQRPTSPFVDSLFSAGSLRKANLSFANASGSLPGILTILRGRYWPEMGRSDFALHDLLKDQGYAIHFLISGNHTTFFGLKRLYGTSIDFYFDGNDTKDYVVNDDRLIFEAFRKVPVQRGKPGFFYIHLNSAHETGYRLPENRVFTPWQHHRSIAEYYTNNYDNGIIQADQYIKRIFQLLKDRGYLQKSVIIITGDHGESLGEKSLFGHSHHLHTEEILIPVLIYDPDKTVSYRGLRYATQVDIAPTIVERLGLPVPDSWTGNSLLRSEKQAYSFHYMQDWYAVIHHANDLLYKYIYNRKTKQEEVYDLETDLYERHNMINEINPEYLRQLRNVRQ